ncbi:MarR family winged helix-turn-helix transcriptional regulator [Yinghuangia seranimata]|uniref:MarR family winged helix-turn-helix transcriptional regulator n=1 Tax=Yinghuangia seranimata TaxID=408067 RepID=UPI00248B89C4|nr:MarR family transcriptional regulator [Yinghuangia seranimata]MDI2129660.1 MarR family transcriptional regulator [Yinghuangia seranimata]
MTNGDDAPGDTADYADGVVTAWAKALPDVDTTSLGFVVRLHQAMIAMEEFDRRSIGGLDLTAPEYMVLAVLAVRTEVPGLTLRQLQPLVMYSSGGMTHCVDRLEKKSLIERRPHPDDRRAVLVCLTDDGRARAEEAMRTRLGALEELLTPLSGDDRRTVDHALRLLIATLGPWTPAGQPRPAG